MGSYLMLVSLAVFCWVLLVFYQRNQNVIDIQLIFQLSLVLPSSNFDSSLNPSSVSASSNRPRNSQSLPRPNVRFVNLLFALLHLFKLLEHVCLNFMLFSRRQSTLDILFNHVAVIRSSYALQVNSHLFILCAAG